MNVSMPENGKNGTLASANAISLTINMSYWGSLDDNDFNGKSQDAIFDGNTYYLDRLLAHEFTHAVMSASLYKYDNIVTREDGSRVREGYALWNDLSAERRAFIAMRFAITKINLAIFT